MKNAILQVGLGECCIDLINLGNFDEFWDDPMLGQLGLSLLFHHLLALSRGRGGSRASGLRGGLLDVDLRLIAVANIYVVICEIVIDFLVCCLVLLVNQRESYVVFEFGNGEVKLHSVF